MSKLMSQQELANLSDDEIMNMTSAPEMEADAPVVEEEKEGDDETLATANTDESKDDSDDNAGSNDTDADDDTAAEPDESGDEDEAEEEDSEDDSEESGSEPDEEGADTESEGEPNNKPRAKVEEKAVEIDYKAAYEQIMTPFKANGKEVKLESADEVVRLMQMGANYTKKLQALQPNLKLLKMLENNGLLEESKLSFLIDLEKRNPAAIQKLVKDSGIDPLEIDTSSTPDYKPGNHSVSDEEIRFTSMIEEVSSDDVGKSMITNINKSWDKESKQALWSDPDILRVLTAQKKNGIYDRVSAEIEHRRMLGNLPSNESFLSSYNRVGQEMDANGLLVVEQDRGAPTSQAKIVDTRVAKRPKVSNNEKARAASTVRSAPKKVASQDFNPLAMSDEDFEKNAELARKV